jgi:hypothetical protein
MAVENDSLILNNLSDLEGEISKLTQRLEPVTISSNPSTGATTQAAPTRSQVSARISSMVVQLRNLQERLDL